MQWSIRDRENFIGTEFVWTTQHLSEWCFISGVVYDSSRYRIHENNSIYKLYKLHI